MQTKELIGLGGVMGIPQAYGFVHYLYDSLLDIIPSLWKNFTTK
jgi:hypothetical protein